jgi:hypothetical protein
MQTCLLPLPASPETEEELTAFARKIILPHSLILKILPCIFLCVFSAFAGKKNGTNANIFYYLSLPLLKQERS